MTSVIMIAPLNAANFESGNAPNTHALFADGEGGSEWREPVASGELTSLGPRMGLHISGSAYESLNAFFFTTSLINGKPWYEKPGDQSVGVFWESGEVSRWVIFSNTEMMRYWSIEDTETAALVVTWLDEAGQLYPGLSVVSEMGEAPYPADYILAAGGDGVPAWQAISAVLDAGSAANHQVLTALGGGGMTWQAPAGGGALYKSYVALLTQEGEAAPVATVLENTLDGTPVWTRNYPGIYECSLAAAFPLDKTVVFLRELSDITSGSSGASFNHSSANSVSVYSGNMSSMESLDNILVRYPIEIRVYP